MARDANKDTTTKRSLRCRHLTWTGEGASQPDDYAIELAAPTRQLLHESLGNDLMTGAIPTHVRYEQASVEGIEYPARRELDKAVVRQLASCNWITEHQVVIITGATGVGKTYVACALATQACRKGHRAMYRRASRLFDELRLARADGTYARVLARIAKIDVLVLDSC